MAETHWDDGTRDDINVETLQPPEWIKQHDVRIGATVPLPLDLVEMGLPPTFPRRSSPIEHCPEIPDGPGRVVLTTVNHLNSYVFELTIKDATGHSETVHTTGFHKFYSDSRNGWISANELRKGEQLRGVNGALTVAEPSRLAGRPSRLQHDGRGRARLPRVDARRWCIILPPAGALRSFQNAHHLLPLCPIAPTLLALSRFGETTCVGRSVSAATSQSRRCSRGRMAVGDRPWTNPRHHDCQGRRNRATVLVGGATTPLLGRQYSGGKDETGKRVVAAIK